VKTKGEYRENLQAVFFPKASGKLAQRLRGLKSYRESRQVFISPAPLLAQARINALLDGKELVMPGPGLKQGFFLLKPFSVPFPKISAAVDLTGISQYGSVIPIAGLAKLEVGITVSEALLVNTKGVRLGDGTGYFDLAVALLHEYGGLGKNWTVWVGLDDSSRLVSDELPADPWDIPVHGVITPGRCYELEQGANPSPQVYWEHLSQKTVRKITPLWKLSSNALRDSRA